MHVCMQVRQLRHRLLQFRHDNRVVLPWQQRRHGDDAVVMTTVAQCQHKTARRS